MPMGKGGFMGGAGGWKRPPMEFDAVVDNFYRQFSINWNKLHGPRSLFGYPAGAVPYEEAEEVEKLSNLVFVICFCALLFMSGFTFLFACFMLVKRLFF